uniref:Zinc finger, CCHC-type n=1 Tax=Tanacetum cinerariifolium TaxID=118510 RepID=A0A6L2N1Q0_TANCI|nr:zinc finger, CCHC-type [Tanacetum cinerariifolium]
MTEEDALFAFRHECGDFLEAKYMTDDASSKKFLVSNFINYKMTDSRLVMKQYNKLLGILERFTQHKMNMDEAIQMEDSDKPNDGPSVVNMVEHNNSSGYNDKKGKRKHHDNTKVDPNKKSKVTCWKWEKPRRLKKNCKVEKVGNKANGSGTNSSVDGSFNSLKGQNMFNKSFQVYYVTYVSEAYFMQDDDVAWWVDSRATIHVCKDRCWFKTYESLNDGSILHMGNKSTALVHGRGCVDPKFSPEKIISLFNVLHVPNIRKNLVSSSVLNNYGYKQVIESNKFFLFKHAFMSTSKLNDSILWHARLGHIRFNRMQDMYKDGVPNKKNMITPYKLWTKRKPTLNHLRVRGCGAVVRLLDPKLKTLGERDIECIFVGYVEHSKAFRFYVTEPNDSVPINSIIESKDAIFDENIFTSVPRPSLMISNRTEDIANNDEMDSIMGNNTWVLSDLPLGGKPLGCKWIFKRKLKVDGTIEKFKARLVIQGLKQKSGIDYFDTYVLVARISTIRLVITMASIHNQIVHQMDVKTTFLNGDLDEEVYMNQPQGFIMPANENKIRKLIKSLYGLKYALKQCHQKFDEVVLSNGYLLNQADKCVYRKFDEFGKGVVICLYDWH